MLVSEGWSTYLLWCNWYPNNFSGELGCNGDPNARPKQCPLPCPSTCESPDAVPCKMMCDPIGCECKPGFILSNATGECVLPNQCPGRSDGALCTVVNWKLVWNLGI